MFVNDFVYALESKRAEFFETSNWTWDSKTILEVIPCCLVATLYLAKIQLFPTIC